MAKVICTELQKDGASGPNITLDTSKNVTCENNLTVDGTSTLSGNVAVTGNVTVTGTLPADKLTGNLPAISGASLTGISSPLSFRNLVINGDFQVAQRGTSSTSSGYYTVDRWKGESGTIGSITVTQSQQSTSSSDEPYKKGFAKFFRLALSGAGTANAGGWIEFQQRIEAQNMANSGWDFKNPAKNVTLSFWIRASTNQTFYCYINTSDGTAKRYSFSFTASGNNAWTKITKTIPGHSDLQFDSDNGNGFQIVITPFYGTNYTNNQTLNAWHTPVSGNYIPDMASTWLTAGASTIDLTGVQLEVGDTATEFEHRPYADELMRCYRYFYMHADGSQSTWQNIGLLAAWTSGQENCIFPFPTRMRTTPSLYKVVGTDYFRCARNNGYQDSDDVGFDANGGNMMGFLTFTDDIASSGGYAGYAQIVDGKTAARIGFHAEI